MVDFSYNKKEGFLFAAKRIAFELDRAFQSDGHVDSEAHFKLKELEQHIMTSCIFLANANKRYDYLDRQSVLEQKFIKIAKTSLALIEEFSAALTIDNADLAWMETFLAAQQDDDESLTIAPQ